MRSEPNLRQIKILIRALALLAAVAIATALGCADFKRGEYWDLEGDGGSGDEDDGFYDYTADVHDLMDSGCERCHAPGNSAGNTDFLIISDDIEASYDSTLDFVDLDSPGSSRLLSKMAGQGHGGGTIFDDRSPEYDLILDWIEQGAPL